LNHHPTTEVLSTYLDGELPALEATTLQAHLAACPDCAARLQALQATAAALRALERPVVPLAVTQRLRRQLAAERERRPRPQWLQVLLPWRMLQPGLAAAALVFVTALLTVVHFERLASRKAETQAASAQRSLEEREREAASAPTVERPTAALPEPASPVSSSLPAARQSAPSQPTSETRSGAPVASSSTRAEELLSSELATGARSDSAAAAEDSWAPSPGQPAAAGGTSPDSARAETAPPPTAVARATERASARPVLSARIAEAAGRVFEQRSGRWLERGLGIEEGPVELLAPEQPGAGELLERWPSLRILLAEAPVRLRHEGRIVELLRGTP
jgi:negative regulator of sigma E activity